MIMCFIHTTRPYTPIILLYLLLTPVIKGKNKNVKNLEKIMKIPQKSSQTTPKTDAEVFHFYYMTPSFPILPLDLLLTIVIKGRKHKNVPTPKKKTPKLPQITPKNRC